MRLKIVWHFVFIFSLTFAAETKSQKRINEMMKDNAVRLNLSDIKISSGFKKTNLLDGTLSVMKADGQPQTGKLTWKLPSNMSEGKYRLVFMASSRIYPFIGSVYHQLEPFRILFKKKNDQGIDTNFQSFSYVFDAETDHEILELPHPLLTHLPTRVAFRSSDHLFDLRPGMDFSLELRYTGIVLCDQIFLVPSDEDKVDLETTASDPVHIFTDKNPPSFRIAVRNDGPQKWSGTIELNWIDLVADTNQIETIPVSIAAWERFEKTALRSVKNGAYELRIALKNKSGKTLLVQQKAFTYSPYIDTASLPDSWPFGNHIYQSSRIFGYAGDTDLPPVGIKWVRIFRGWGRDIEEKAKGESYWNEMDEAVALCKKQGQKILWVCMMTPTWASSQPKEKNPRAWPPADWDDLRDFLKVFWTRYAPGGKIDTIAAVEIWNEPNVTDWCRFTPEEYVKLGEVIFKTTREFAPGAKVVGISASGGLQMGYINGVLNAGIGEWMDTASFHIYENDSPKGVVSIGNKTVLFQEALRKKDLSVPVWDTECGTQMGIRGDGKLLSQEELNGLVAGNSNFNPVFPWKIGNSWRAPAERTGAAWMARSLTQKLSMGIEKMFIYRWVSGAYSWLGDANRADIGNPTPKLAIPMQAVLSDLWLHYGGKIESAARAFLESEDYELYNYRFSGKDGSFTVLFTHPKKVTTGTTDEVAAKNASHVDPDSDNAAKTPLNPWLRTKTPPKLEVAFRTSKDRVTVMDFLGRDAQNLEAKEGKVKVLVGDEPVYLVEKL